MDIIGRTAFGHDFTCSKTLRSSPVAEAFEYLLDDFTQRSFNNILHPAHLFYWLPTARNRLHAKNMAVVRDAIDDILLKRKELREKDRSLEHHDILKYMLDAFEEQNVAADADTLSDNLVTMLFAGYDTSSITLTYAFYLMARHPEVAARCRQEVVSAIGATAFATYNDVQTQLPLCTAVICETLRLYPPAPVTVRYTEAPVELMPGIVAPAGTVRVAPASSPLPRAHPRCRLSICPFGGSTARPTTSTTPTRFGPRGSSHASASASTTDILSSLSAAARGIAWAGVLP
jgi:cytochrome P450